MFKQQVDHLVEEISCLKTELKIIPAMQASIESLKEEIAELRKLRTAPHDRHRSAPVSYANAVMKSSRQTGVHPNSNSNQAAATNAATKATNATSASGFERSSAEKEKVAGVRRVWKTMRSATSFTISSTLKKLTSVGNKLMIRRKSRPGSASGKSTYWFIIKSNEDVLQKLDEEWDQVQMQIGWKLENCYRPVTTQQILSAAGDEDETHGKDDDTVTPPTLQSESPRLLTPALSTKSNEANATGELSDSDGAGESGSSATCTNRNSQG